MQGNPSCPDFLCHYYEKSKGPFLSLSNIPLEQAEVVLDAIRAEGVVFASRRAKDYLSIRRELEVKIRAMLIAKGGQPVRGRPHYMILGSCPWLLDWYREGCELRIPLSAVDPGCVSFTYGDSFPAMRYQDGKPYRGLVYTLEELPALLRQYGLPQDWNPDGKGGPERYIEAQVWEDGAILSYQKGEWAG